METEKKLFKYDGPVLNGNNRVRNENYVAYTTACSPSQALRFLLKRYQSEYGLTSKDYVKMKKDYLRVAN